VKAREAEFSAFSILYLHYQAMKLNNKKNIFYKARLCETSTNGNPCTKKVQKEALTSHQKLSC